MAVSTDPISSTRSLISPARIWRQLQSMTFAIIMLSVILLVIIAVFTGLSFLSSRFWVHYDD